MPKATSLPQYSHFAILSTSKRVCVRSARTIIAEKTADCNTLNKKYGRGFDKYINLALKMKELRDKAKAKEEAANSAEEIEME